MKVRIGTASWFRDTFIGHGQWWFSSERKVPRGLLIKKETQYIGEMGNGNWSVLQGLTRGIVETCRREDERVGETIVRGPMTRTL